MESKALVKILNKVFKTKCSYDASGKMKNGPGTLCGLYILIIIAALVYGLFFPREGLTEKEILKGRIFDIVYSLISIIFMYHMCFICRGFVGFLILFMLSVAQFIYAFTKISNIK